MVLEAIKYDENTLEVLDQLQLPHRVHYDQIKTAEEAWHAIKDINAGSRDEHAVGRIT